MKYLSYFFGGLLLGILFAFVVTAFGTETIQVCQEPDGTVTYTNKNFHSLCAKVELPEISVAPTRKNYLPAPKVEVPPVTPPSASFVNDKMCELYEEWMELSGRTMGGFNRNSVKDTQRRLVLVQLFGGGFAPSSCK